MTEPHQQHSLLGKIAAYTEILAKDPTSTIFVSLSEAYRKMGMLDDARQVVEQGIELHDDFSPAYIVLGRILCQQGDYDGSESSFQQALKFDGESLAALVGYARLKILLGREADARQKLLIARQLSPADPVINKLLLSLPDDTPVEIATETVEQVTVDSVMSDSVEEAVVAPPLASSTLAELYLKQGLAQQALEVYRQLSIDDPDNLLLRRKIRDIEDGQLGIEVEESKIKPIDSPEISAGVDSEVEEPPAIEAAELEVTPAVSVGSATRDLSAAETCQPIPEEQVLTTLHKWLASIQQRREHV